jgi:hypothetical protein
MKSHTIKAREYPIKYNPKINCIKCDIPTENINFLRNFFEETTGSTYPSKTLKRRLNLLSKEELEEATKYWSVICYFSEKMDELLVNRSEIAQDPWP